MAISINRLPHGISLSLRSWPMVFYAGVLSPFTIEMAYDFLAQLIVYGTTGPYILYQDAESSPHIIINY